jgi:hypothetical protein
MLRMVFHFFSGFEKISRELYESQVSASVNHDVAGIHAVMLFHVCAVCGTFTLKQPKFSG